MHKIIYQWSTGRPHANNYETLCDFVCNEMPDDWELTYIKANYAEIETPEGKIAVTAAGDGDFNNHAIWQYDNVLQSKDGE